MTTMTAIKPIKTDADHEAALRELDALWGAPVGSPDGDRLDVLVTLVEAYESGRWPVAEMDPVEALECVIESGEHSRAELAAIIGQSRATEVLQRKRALTLPQIRAIADAWHLPIEVLAKCYRLEETASDRKLIARRAEMGLLSRRKRAAPLRAAMVKSGPKRPKR